MGFLQRFIRDDRGTTAMEYSLIAGLIAIVLVGSLTAIGTRILPRYQAVANALT